MKKAYILLGALATSGMLLAQSPTTAPMHQFSTSNGKYDANGITVVENRVTSNQDRPGPYYSEDFDGGFNGWTAATQAGPVDFEITSVGHANNAGSTFIIPDLLSSTPTQWVMLDSDGAGSANVAENATLTSPVIDLSPTGLNAPASVKLEFEQFFAEWEGNADLDTYDSCFVAVTIDGGLTWNEVEINAEVGRDARPNPEVFQVNIADWIVGGEDNVQIRFRWAGSWNYGWQIDNVTIVDLEQEELATTTPFTRNIYDANVNYAVQYAQVPLSQVHELTLGCVVKNLGYNVMNNVGIDFRILDGTTELATGTTTTENLASLAAGPLGESDTVWFNTGWTPSATGDYQIEMVVNSDGGDDDTSNDTVVADYRVTDYLYAREMAPATGSLINIADSDLEFQYGAMYEIFADTDIHGISITLDSANTGDLVYVQLKKWNGTTWDYAATSEDHEIVPTDQGNEITLILQNTEAATAGDLYLAVYGHYGGAEAPSIQTVGTDFDGNILFDDAGESGGFIGSPTPKVRLNLDPVLSVNEEVKEVAFSVYPNPVANELTVAIANVDAVTTLTVRDIAGQLISTQRVNATQTTINTEALASGVYFVEVSNGSSRNVQKITKK